MRHFDWAYPLALGYLGLVSGQSTTTTTTAASGPRCSSGATCASLLGSAVIASGPCVDSSGNGCTTRNIAVQAAAYSRAHGGVTYAYDSNFNVYAISAQIPSVATTMNVKVNVGSATCSSAVVNGFYAFTNTCFAAASSTTAAPTTVRTTTAAPTTSPIGTCNSQSTCIAALQKANCIITSAPCSSYAGQTCNADALPRFAWQYSRANSGVTYAYGLDSTIYALRCSASDAAKAMGTAVITGSATCMGAKTGGVALFDNSCIKAYSSTTTTAPTTTTTSSAPCGGNPSNCAGLISQAGKQIATTSCQAIKGSACTPQEVSYYAALYAKSVGASSYGYNAQSGAIYAYNASAANISYIINITIVVNGNCQGASTYPFYLFDISCAAGVTTTAPTTTTTTTTTRTTTTVPPTTTTVGACGGNNNNCAALLNGQGYQIGVTTCAAFKGSACTAADFPVYAARYSNSKGGVAYGYNLQTGQIYAYSGSSRQMAPTINANANLATKGSCTGMNLNPMYIFDITCAGAYLSTTTTTITTTTVPPTTAPPTTVPPTTTTTTTTPSPTTTVNPACNGNLNNCAGLLQNYGYQIGTISCSTFKGSPCTSAADYELQAAKFAQQQGGRAYGWDPSNGQIYAYSATSAQMAGPLQATPYLTTRGSNCQGLTLNTLQIYDFGCANAILTTITTTTTTTTTTTPPPPPTTTTTTTTVPVTTTTTTTAGQGQSSGTPTPCDGSFCFLGANGFSLSYYGSQYYPDDRGENNPIGNAYYVTQNLPVLGTSQSGNLDVGFVSNAGPQGTRQDVKGIQVNSNNFTIVYQGFWSPVATGNFKMCARADNEVSMWIGDGNAFSCQTGAFSTATPPRLSKYTSIGLNGGTNCVTLNMRYGVFYPFRLQFTNYKGPYGFDVTVTRPDGTVTNNLNSYPFGCLGQYF